MWSPWVGSHRSADLPPASFETGPAPSEQQQQPAALPGPGMPIVPHATDYAAPLVDLSQSVAAPALPLPPPPPGAVQPAAAAHGLGAAVPENGHTLGLALLLVGVGSAIGVKYGGLFGGTAGAVYGGSAVNAIRAARSVTLGTPDADKEAMVSATYAVIGASFATWLIWKSSQRKKATT
jgi:hypothetical protein